jgi:hypothetical protein
MKTALQQRNSEIYVAVRTATHMLKANLTAVRAAIVMDDQAMLVEAVNEMEKTIRDLNSKIPEN